MNEKNQEKKRPWNPATEEHWIETWIINTIVAILLLSGGGAILGIIVLQTILLFRGV